MIQKILLTTSILLVIFFTGCSKKDPDLQNGMNNVSDVAQISGDTVTINENTYDKDKNKNLGSSGSYNSSSDGFQSIYFGFGDYSISPDMENHIATNVNLLSRSNTKIKIEGNCDEFGTDEYNYALGLKRAKAVKDSIVSHGIGSDKMVIISFGESNPVCSNPTDTCYAQNRRVDLRLIK